MKYIDSSLNNSTNMLIASLKEQLASIDKAYDEICVACIGTDRSTGDSLGPLVGYKLSNSNIKVIGTLDAPLHAQNLSDFNNSLSDKTLVIAVDACLGRMEHVGYISVKQGSIKPGSGVDKDLPPIGDISVTGIVNFGGFMDFLVLQNTRLSVVMKMADIISDGLRNVLQEELLNA